MLEYHSFSLINFNGQLIFLIPIIRFCKNLKVLFLTKFSSYTFPIFPKNILWIIFFLIPMMGTYIGYGQINKPPVDYDTLLKDITRSRQQLKKPTPLSLAHQEETRVLAFSHDEKKILFLKKIRANGKLQQDLILFDSTKKELHNFRFKNPFFYNNKKKKLITENELIRGTLFGTTIESEMVKHPLIPLDLLFIRDKGTLEKNKYKFFPSLQIFLDNQRERYLLGKIQIRQALNTPIRVKKMYLSSQGRIIVLLLSYTYMQNNKVYQRQEILGFDLYSIVVNKNLKVHASNQFDLNNKQKNFSFQKNIYYNERDEWLFTEILLQSGLKKISGKGFYLY